MEIYKWVKGVFSIPTTVLLLILFASSLAIGTYIENLYDYESAAASIYLTWWFEGLMVWLVLCLLAQIVKFKLYKKERVYLLLFHLSFILLFIGGALSRYSGFEGSISLREGQSASKIKTKESSLCLYHEKMGKPFCQTLYLSALGGNDFDFDIPFLDKVVNLSFVKYEYEKNRLHVKLTQGEFESKKVIKGGAYNTPLVSSKIRLGEKQFLLSRGSIAKDAPFLLYLDKLHIKKYPGSKSPSMISADLQLIDEKEILKKTIAVNKPVTYGKYTLFIAAYDKDEKGMRISVNYDPGKWWVYGAYLLFCLGMLATLLSKKSRVGQLLRGVPKAVLLSLVLGVATSSYALPPMMDKSYANTFATIIVQGNDGRMKPLDTVNQSIFTKIVGAKKLQEYHYNQVILGMSFKPNLWQKEPMFRLKDKRFQKALHVKKEIVSFEDLFDAKGRYLLRELVDKVLSIDESSRGVFQKELLKLDERVNIAYLVYAGKVLKIFPKEGDINQKWFDPNSAMNTFTKEERVTVGRLLEANKEAIDSGYEKRNWSRALDMVEKIKAYQKALAPELLPSKFKLKTEILYNHWQIFAKLYPLYLIAGFILLIQLFWQLLYTKERVSKFWYGFAGIAFVVHTFALGARWYIAGHAPWSNAYEGMLYIAWSALGVGLLFYKRISLSLPVTLLFSGICLFVAHLSWMDPLITTLVPSLQSYWLTIHVAVISASYGFLGLSALLGLMTMVLLIIMKKEQFHKLNVDELLRLNELSMVLGLFLLTLGTFLGSIWANETWGRYWGWDAKEVWSLITIILYSLVLHLRLHPRFNSYYLFTLCSVLFYGAVIMTYFGVNYYLSGLHSYGTIEATEIPDATIYTVLALVAIMFLSFPKRKLLKR